MVTNFKFGENENPNFIDLFKSDEIDQSGAQEEGLYIKGKDSIYLDAPAIYPSRDTPLLTDAQDFAGAINELFRDGGGGGDEDDWQPPEWWIPVPEPAEYEILILVWVTDTNNSFELSLQNNETGSSGYANVFCDWGDGTETTYPAEYFWGSARHNFAETGQYLIKITTSESLNVVYARSLKNCYWQIIKTGNNILFVSDYFNEHGYRNTPLSNHNRLKYIKINNEKGLPVDKSYYYFELDYALQKIELKKPMSGNIPEQSFRDNYALTDFSRIPFDGNSVNTVGNYAFSNCYGLKKIILPNCTSIGDYAFQNCYNLQEIIVPEDCTFGTNCFQNCYSLYPRPDGSTN